MQEPLRITFRNMPPSKAVEMDVREKVEKLERVCHRITGCHVTIEEPHQHHQQGRVFHVKIGLFLPRKVIMINRESELNHAHEDPYVAIRDSFNAMKRKLQNYSMQHR